MYTQAWAFAVGVRLCLGKVPFMNMDDFDKETWYLHRKLFHRFVKYAKYFRQATEVLPAYEKAHLDEQDELVKK